MWTTRTINIWRSLTAVYALADNTETPAVIFNWTFFLWPKKITTGELQPIVWKPTIYLLQSQTACSKTLSKYCYSGAPLCRSLFTNVTFDLFFTPTSCNKASSLLILSESYCKLYVLQIYFQLILTFIFCLFNFQVMCLWIDFFRSRTVASLCLT